MQARNKRERLACFASQAETLALLSSSTERYRRAPAYDFGRPPHPGRLFYEGFPWGMDGARFCELARQAAQELGI